jgi:hypothetical protein
MAIQGRDFVSGRVVMYKTRAFASEAPYSDAFVVDTRWVFEQIDDDKVRMRVFMDIIFIKSCWVKSMSRPWSSSLLIMPCWFEAMSTHLVSCTQFTTLRSSSQLT